MWAIYVSVELSIAKAKSYDALAIARIYTEQVGSGDAIEHHLPLVQSFLEP